MDGGQDRWVFGYGSLMWRPGFAYQERRPAVLNGLHRAFCIYSVHHRGTPEAPGLVLGLADGGEVQGMAYRIGDEDWEAVYAYLLEREQPTETYIESMAQVALDDGREVETLVFLSDKTHPQWAGELSLDRQAGLIARSTGLSGRNVDYLSDLVAHLREAAIVDSTMEALLEKANALLGLPGSASI